MRSRKVIEEHFLAGRLPQKAGSVVFKVPNKTAGNKLLAEMWVAGNKFRALPYVPDKADTLCRLCSQWGHSEFRCQRGAAVCAICAGDHWTEGHKCEVATCGKIGRVCAHTAMMCPNCGGNHPAQDGRCRAKSAAVAIARGGRGRMVVPEPSRTMSPPRLIEGRDARGQSTNPEWTEDDDAMVVTGTETSGTAPPMAV